MQISQSGIDLIKRVEGFTPVAKPDYKQWSIGYGTKSYKGAKITKKQAEVELKKYLAQVAVPCINAFLDNRTIPQNEFDALVSVAYNMGCSGFKNTELALHYARHNKPQARNWFTDKSRCCNAGGKFNQGVYNRREKELAHFNSGGVPTSGTEVVVASLVPISVVGILSYALSKNVRKKVNKVIGI